MTSDAPASRLHKTHARGLVVLALASGACALAYEVLLVRLLTTLFGDVFYVPATILSTFLLGIGLGAKASDEQRGRLWAFEIATGVYALFLTGGVPWIGQQAWLSVVTGSPLLTVILTSGMALAPGLLIGFSLPLFSGRLKDARPTPQAFSRTYAAYHIGTIISVLTVEFFLVRSIGIRAVIWGAAAINITVGLILFRWFRGVPPTASEPVRPFAGRSIVALGLASFASATFQMFLLKMGYHLFSPHRENFAVVLTLTLLGILLGTWLVMRLRLRPSTCVLWAACLLTLAFSAYPQLVRFHQLTDPSATGSLGLAVLHKLMTGSVLALGPLTLLGGLIPAMMRSEQDVTAESGRLLWVSSSANAAGYMFYVFIGHEFLPVWGLLGGVALLLVVSGFLFEREFETSFRGALAGVVALGIVALAILWQPAWFYIPRWAPTMKPTNQLRVFKSGPDSATLLDNGPRRYVSYNGHASIRVDTSGKVNASEMLSGVVAALHVPKLERALVLGLGAGITAGTTARIFQHTDVVEINEAFFDMMPDIAFANLAIGTNPAATLHHNDARAFLVGQAHQYDAVVNSIPAADYFAASKVYTVEFYDRVVDALAPGGVFCTWLAVPNMTDEGVRIILSALRERFSDCELRLVGSGYYMVTCANRPLRPRGWSEVQVDPLLSEALHKTLAPYIPAEVIEDIRLSPNIFATYEPESSVLNTDDRPVLEFLTIRRKLAHGAGVELFLEEPRVFNIDPVGSAALSADRMIRRAGIHKLFNTGFFGTHFAPLIKDDPALQAAKRRWFHAIKGLQE